MSHGNDYYSGPEEIMGRRRSFKGNRYARLGVGAGIVGVALIAIALIPWHDIFGGTAGSAGATGASPFASPPTSESGNDSPSFEPPKTSTHDNPLQHAQKGDVFASTPADENPFGDAGGGTSIHEVVIKATSDGALYIGYRYRDGKGDGIRVVDSDTTITRRVRGPLPLAQIGLQVMSNATFGTCTIYIDGVKVISRTAHHPGYVTVCTA